MLRVHISKEVYEKLRQLIYIPIYLYEECIEEGMSQEEAIEETYRRFYE
jgi:glutamate formiminotransferase